MSPPDNFSGDSLLFSVVVPMYNKKDYIKRCLQSVFAQNLFPFEIIVVDDGSTDGSKEQVESLFSARPYCQLISQSNRGVGSARNVGILQAKGDWVAFLDADDAWFPDHLKELQRVISCYPSAGLVSSSFTESREMAIPKKNRKWPRNVITEIDYISMAYRKKNFVCSSCIAVRLNVFEAVGLFGDWRLGEDTEMWTRIALEYQVAVSKRVTSIYFRGTSGVMEKKGKESDSIDEPISSIESLSPALSLVLSRIKENPSLLNEKSIRDHVNGRLVLGIKSALIGLKIWRAKSFLLYRVPGARISDEIWFLICRLPDGVIRSMFKGRHHLKNKIKNLVRGLQD